MKQGARIRLRANALILSLVADDTLTDASITLHWRAYCLPVVSETRRQLGVIGLRQIVGGRVAADETPAAPNDEAESDR